MGRTRDNQRLTLTAVRRRKRFLYLDYMTLARHRASDAMRLGFYDSALQYLHEFDYWHAALRRLVDAPEV